MTHILLTNDDGIYAAGLQALAAELASFATVSIVASHREQSGTARSLTLRQPLICNQVAERQWAVESTPAVFSDDAAEGENDADPAQPYLI